MTVELPPPLAGAVAADRFPPHSRYANSEVITSTDADGTEHRQIGRRFIPPQDGLSTVAEHLVTAGERLDLMAQQYYGDPLLSWRIADANGADDPSDLVAEPGRVLHITAPDTSGGFGGRMIERIQLNLLAGSLIPLPVPSVIIQAVKSLQVTVSAGQRSAFQLVLANSKTSPLSTTMIPAGLLDPGVRVVIVVTVNGMPNVLMDGVITRQEAGFSNEMGQSAITLTGEDLTVLMDLEKRQGVIFPPLPAVGQVLWILKDYLIHGIVPIPVPELFPDVPIPVDRIKSQDGTDLEFIQKLAKDNGYVFYLDPGPIPGMSKAYWGPEIRVGTPQPALSVDMDAMTNVDSLSFSFDGLQRKQVVVRIQEPTTKLSIDIPLPDLNLLAPPLAIRQAPSLKVEPLAGSAKDNPILAMAKGLAAVSESADAITGSGQLNVLRYGRVLSARGLVGVRGAGTGYDGLYYVKSVTHNIKAGEYTQSFSLARNGLVSITPVVPV